MNQVGEKRVELVTKAGCDIWRRWNLIKESDVRNVEPESR